MPIQKYRWKVLKAQLVYLVTEVHLKLETRTQKIQDFKLDVIEVKLTNFNK